MMVVFDAILDKTRTPLIQTKIKAGKSGFRTKWGLYGTEEWLINLRNDGLVIKLNGKISQLRMTGHNDFPEFEMETETGKYQFERLGNEAVYGIGKTIMIEAVYEKYILPKSGIENLLSPIRIEIE